MQLKGDLAAIKGHAPIEIAEAGGHPVVVREGTRIPSGGTPHATGVKTQGKSVDKATELAAKTQHARELRAKADNASTHASDTKQEVAKPDSGVANQRSASTQAPDTKQDTPGNSGAVVGNESESSTKSPSKKPKLSAEKIAELQARAEARKKGEAVPETSGERRGRVGNEREAEVARLVGGKMSGEEIRDSRYGKSDVDVVAPNGDLIAVGGPQKAGNIENTGRVFRLYRAVAEARGVKAMAYLTQDTPQNVVDLAIRILGAANVMRF